MSNFSIHTKKWEKDLYKNKQINQRLVVGSSQTEKKIESKTFLWIFLIFLDSIQWWNLCESFLLQKEKDKNEFRNFQSFSFKEF